MDYVVLALSFPVLVFASLTVMVRNIVYAAVFLILTLLSIATIYIGLHADFIAASQVAIYVGAISILILFSVMFTHDLFGKQLTHLNRQAVLGVFIALMLFGTISFYIINTKNEELSQNLIGHTPDGGRPTSVLAISKQLYEPDAPYAVPVEMASFMLLAAVVGGIEMAKKKEDEV